jgi:intein-encoded DNA endonuclease-like protein
MPRGYKNGRASVTVAVRFYYDSPEARVELMEELRKRFETIGVTVGSWGYDRHGSHALIDIITESK